MREAIYTSNVIKIIINENNKNIVVLNYNNRSVRKLSIPNEGENALLELHKVLQGTNKSWEDIKALSINVRSEIAPNTVMEGEVKYYRGVETLDYLSIDEVLYTLAHWNYDDGYGCQELDGTVLFDDGTWLERKEYDGSEWWAYHRPPTVEDIFGEVPREYDDEEDVEEEAEEAGLGAFLARKLGGE